MKCKHGDLLKNSALALVEECEKRGIKKFKGYSFMEKEEYSEDLFLSPGESIDLIEGDIYFYIYNMKTWILRELILNMK